MGYILWVEWDRGCSFIYLHSQQLMLVCVRVCVRMRHCLLRLAEEGKESKGQQKSQFPAVLEEASEREEEERKKKKEPRLVSKRNNDF